VRIITYSDLHLEFGSGWKLPAQASGDLMILAGDIVAFKDYHPLDRLFESWKKPVLYIAGNHEYYTRSPMDHENSKFNKWLEDNHPHVKLLLDESAAIGGVHFFGGTMWTDFNGGDRRAMDTAQAGMSDYEPIYTADRRRFTPADSIALHQTFVKKLLEW